MKRCSRCKEAKPETAFAKDKSRADGLQNACRECHQVDRAKRKQCGLAPDDPRHGTKAAYIHWACRCEPCCAAGSADYKNRKQRGLEPDDPRHGTKAGYDTWACRCEPCCNAYAAYKRFYVYEWSNEAEEAFHLAQACDLCHKPFDSNKRDTAKAVDHDHVHGFVRGVLHGRCNASLNDGDRDTIQMLEDALASGDHQTANYLLKTVQTV